MRVDNFSAVLQPGNELPSGYVELQHGQTYAIRLTNFWPDRRADAEVEVDGKLAGCFRVNPGNSILIERPSNEARLFTCYGVDTKEGVQTGLHKVDNVHQGLVRVTFKAEPQRTSTPVETLQRADHEEKTSGGLYSKGIRTRGGWSGQSVGGQHTNSNPTMRSRGFQSLPSPQAQAAGTGLSGHSNQTFVQAVEIIYDETTTTIISLRLVALLDQPSELQPAPKANPVPGPLK
jgi:hypothetical protein